MHERSCRDLDLLRRTDRFWNKPQHAAYLFVAPAIIIIMLFTIVPLFAALVLGLYDVNIFLSEVKFVGLQNFIEAFNDSRFLNACKVTGLFTLFDVPVSISFSLLVAFLVKGSSIREKLFRSIYILPLICSATVIGLIWKLFLNPVIGWGVAFMESLGLPKLAIFSDTKLAIYGIIFISIWRRFGVTSMILVAGMQAVSNDLYEAAELDGAGKIRQFFHVTIPGIASTLWFVLITRVIGSFQVFDLVYVVTGGGPAHTTETIVSYVYNTSFQVGNRLGYATAISEILFFIILLITIILYGKMIKQEREGGIN